MINDAMERVQRHMAGTERIRSCERCKGVWFHQITMNRYTSGLYSSSPGSEISAAGLMAIEVLICACGQIVPPTLTGVRAPTAQSEASSLMDSLALANKTISHADANIKTLAKKVEELAAELESLKNDKASIDGRKRDGRSTRGGDPLAEV